MSKIIRIRASPARDTSTDTHEDDAQEIDVELATAAASAAIVRFVATRPGKRSAALASLWAGLTGTSRDGRAWQYADNHLGMVLRYYSALPGDVRARARAVLAAALAIEPDPDTRAGIATLAYRMDRCAALTVAAKIAQREAHIRHASRARRRAAKGL